MCEFCIKHGEGKKWYEVMDHYSQELLATGNRETYINNFFPNLQRSASSTIAKLKWVKTNMPLAHRFIRKIGNYRMKQLHFGQVVPLEDAESILDLVQSVTRIPCVCRSITAGHKDARYCLVLGIDPAGMFGDYPDLRSSLETLTIKQAKAFLRDFDQMGLVHSIWTFKTPFIGAICNCDHDCLAYKIQIAQDLMEVMFPGESIADINLTECVGCRNCQKLCQFGAIEYSAANSKCYINYGKCYGCGLCRTGCHKSAITLIDKALETNEPGGLLWTKK